MANDPRSLGPECAVLTGIGTLYLYRMGPADVRAFRDLPGTKLSSDKFRVLLARIASLHVSEKGILDAGSLTPDQVESLSDDEIERVAESYLDSTSVRWYRHEGASATLSVIRDANEPATKFLDRLIHWYATRGPGRVEGDGLSATAPRPRPRMAPPDAIVLTRREAWIALGALGVLAILGIAALGQHWFLVRSLQRQQDELIVQSKQSNALLSSFVARSTQESAHLRQRIDALEATLRSRSAAARPSEAPKPAQAAAPRKVKPKR